MDQLSEFVVNHWLLVTAFCAVLGLLVANLVAGAGGVSPQAAVIMINREGAVVVDVRPAAEFAGGHIIDAVNLPLSDIAAARERLKRHRDKPVLVYCASGTTAGQAVKQLKAMGFGPVQVLRGGLGAWRAENLPVTSA
jgi:rhodanese-related sulfurtransferase